MRVGWRHLAGLIAAVAAILMLVAWSGIYNVAASRGHWAIVDWLLRFGMENSVEAHAPDVAPPPLDDPDRIALGAAHFHAGCAYCHGAPDAPISPVARAMLPPPPDLRDRVGRWSDQELFQIVRHGIKYAGMPAWPVAGRDDEVWSVVAFLRRLPMLDAAAYRDLALGPVRIRPQDGRAIATGTAVADAVGACARCHGAEGEGPRSALVPRLHGQPAPMLGGAMREYAARQRASGIMQLAAAGLSDREIAELAAYYAALPPLPAALPAEAGARPAREGDTAAGVPACLPCHTAGALAQYPRLAGQNARYIAARLRAWQGVARPVTPGEAIMLPIAHRLDDRRIDELAAYFAGMAP